jgi:L-rhamnose-H+ transport protein
MIPIGLLLAVISGLCNGVFTAPMKLESRWKWENIWLVFILTACVAMPWTMVWTTVPGFAGVLAAAPRAAVYAACLFGFLWGFGAICFGRSVDSLGVSVANSVVLGLSSGLGSLIPLLMTHPAVSPAGLTALIAGVGAFLVGVWLCGSAGRLRDGGAAGKASARALTGYAFAVTAGVMSAVFNIGYTLALPISHTALRQGYSQSVAPNVIWLLMLGAGAIPNSIYCLYLMKRNSTGALLAAPHAGASWLRAVGMGLLWGGSIFLYGAATPRLGSLGPSVGWPLSLAVGLLVANLMGVLLGEWRNANRAARRRMHMGIWVLLGAIVLCAVATRSGS